MRATQNIPKSILMNQKMMRNGSSIRFMRIPMKTAKPSIESSISPSNTMVTMSIQTKANIRPSHISSDKLANKRSSNPDESSLLLAI